MLSTPSDQDPIAFRPSVAAAPSTSPSPQMLRTCNDLKIWLLAFPSLARLYSTHPSGSATTSLSPCKLGSSFCQDSGSGFRGVDSCPLRDVTVLCVLAAMKTWHLDPLTLDRLYSTHLDSSAANSLSPFKLWNFFCLVFFAVGLGTYHTLGHYFFSMLSRLYSTYPSSSAAISLSPICMLLIVYILAHVPPLQDVLPRFSTVWLPVFSFDFLVVRLAQTVPLFSQIHSFVYRHPQEASAPTLRSGDSVCGRIALFDLGMVVSLVL